MILNANLPPTATAQTRSFSLRISFGNVNKYYLAEDLFNFTLEILNKNFIFMVWVSKFPNSFNVLFYDVSHPLDLDFLFFEPSGLRIWKSL